MDFILLTQNTTPIIGQVAWLLGLIMNGIFYVIDLIGLPNVGLAIILFTIVVNLLMMPLTIKQQKFSKLNAKMSPEIQAIQAKYKNRKDTDSQMAQNQEIQAVYAKYGVSASGSCVQLLIQMPILFALYRVIYSMPAYVTKIKDTFTVLAEHIISVDNGNFIKNSEIETIASTVRMYGQSIEKGNLTNGIIDVLNRLSSTDLATVADHYHLNDLTYEGQLILSNDTTRGLIDIYNNFLGLNMGDSPSLLIRNALSVGAYGIVIGALLIPILSMVTQWINVKLMPQQPTENKDTSSMAQSMKMMNNFMPIMSAVFCFTLPSGMGLYWVAGSVVRSIQQIIINKHMDKMDFDEIIQKNSVKSAKKIEKMKKTQERMNTYAAMNTRNIQNKANTTNNPAKSINRSGSVQSGTAQKSGNVQRMSQKASIQGQKSANVDYNRGEAKPGSMMAKANMVKKYNEQNNRDNKSDK